MGVESLSGLSAAQRAEQLERGAPENPDLFSAEMLSAVGARLSQYVDPESWLNLLKLRSVGDLGGYAARAVAMGLGGGAAISTIAQVFGDEGVSAFLTMDYRDANRFDGKTRYGVEFLEGFITGLILTKGTSMLTARLVAQYGAAFMLGGKGKIIQFAGQALLMGAGGMLASAIGDKLIGDHRFELGAGHIALRFLDSGLMMSKGRIMNKGADLLDHHVYQGSGALLDSERFMKAYLPSMVETVEQTAFHGKALGKSLVKSLALGIGAITGDDGLVLAAAGNGVGRHSSRVQPTWQGKWLGEKERLHLIAMMSGRSSDGPSSTSPAASAAEVPQGAQVSSPWVPVGKFFPGLGVSKGPGRFVTGKATFDSGKAKGGWILVKELTTPGDWTAMKEASGMVTTKGGPLSHAALTARELSKHAVIVDNGVVHGSELGGGRLVIGTGSEAMIIKERDLIRVLGQDEGGGLLVIPNSDWLRYDHKTRAKFYLEELLWGAESQSHDSAREALETLLDNGRVTREGVCIQTDEMIDHAVRELQIRVEDPKFALLFKSDGVQDLIAALQRLQGFSEKAPAHLSVLEAKLKGLQAEIAEGMRVRGVGQSSSQITGTELRQGADLLFPETLLFTLGEVGGSHVSHVGGKFARLGDVARMTDVPAKVPNGVGLAHAAFERFLTETGRRIRFDDLQAKIDAVLARGGDSLARVTPLCREMQQLLRDSRAPLLAREIESSVRAALPDDVPFAVRSSGILEDSQAAAYAGMAKTHLNVRLGGNRSLMPVIQDVWASFWEPQGVCYRAAHRELGAPRIGVAIQEMINGETSGVVWSRDLKNDGSFVVIAAGLGLGEGIVNGQVAIDTYKVGEDGAVRQTLTQKKTQIVSDPAGGAKVEAVAGERISRPSLTESQAKTLAEIARRLEAHYGFEVDMEFTIRNGEIYVLQVRPLTGAKRSVPTVVPTLSQSASGPFELLRAAQSPLLCFVCTGNRHRSAAMHLLMESALQEAGLGDRVLVRSGGFGVSPGKEMDLEIVALAMAAKIPPPIINAFSSRSVTFDEGMPPTLILVAEEGMKGKLARDHPHLAARIFAFNELAPHAFPGAHPDIVDPLDMPDKRVMFEGIANGISKDLLPLVRLALEGDNAPAMVLPVERAREPAMTMRTVDPSMLAFASEILDQRPELAQVLDEHHWSEGERAELFEAVKYMRDRLVITDDFNEFALDNLEIALEALHDAPFDRALQLKALQFVVYTYKEQGHLALADIELALLAKIDQWANSGLLQSTDIYSLIEHLKPSATPRDIAATAAIFMESHRFRGFKLLQDHFNARSPLDRAAAQDIFQRLIAHHNYLTADDLDGIGLTESGDWRRVMCEADQEANRRAARVPRALNRERKILFDEIAEFYMMQALKGELTVLERYRLSEQGMTSVQTLRQTWVEREARLFNWIREYMVHAVYGEIIHHQNSEHDFHLAKHVGISLTGLPLKDLDIETFMHLATEEEIRVFLHQAAHGFSSTVVQEVGGYNWSKIAKFARSMWEADAPRDLLIEGAFQLKHNNNIAFDKSKETIILGRHDEQLLDLKRDGRSLDKLYQEMRGHLSDTAKQRIEEWMAIVASIRAGSSR